MTAKTGREKKQAYAEKMLGLVSQWQQSGQTQNQFCRERSIKPHVFWYWLRRYRERRGALKQQTKSFVSLEVEETIEAGVLAEILYSNGTRLIFKQAVGVKILQHLLPKV